MSAALLLSALIILLVSGAWWQRRALPLDATPLVDTLDNLLPQTQCAQCGYAGCRPYAQAMAEGRAASNLCPPGGEALFVQLQSILGDDAAAVPLTTHTGVAVIDEADCIGCALCLPACPVDAIVGAHGHMHTVLPRECTGCELCVPACPVDCIRMVDDAPAATPEPVEPASPADHQGCIRCGACDDACPVNLPAQDLFASLSLQHLDSARTLGVQTCIECGLCDRACPSHIPLVSGFRQAKSAIYQQSQAAIERERLKQRFSRHSQRIIASEQHSQQQRAARLNKKHQWGSE